MNILAIDTSSVAVGVALWQQDFLLGEYHLNTKLTHSVTLMEMVDSLFTLSELPKQQLDALAVTVGPGSFTGLRIGLSAVKGMAFALQKPCVAVSTLEALAYNLEGIAEGYLCPVMDARCAQVYTALFRCQKGTIERVTEDMAISIVELGEKLKSCQLPIYLVGDGTLLCAEELGKMGIATTSAPPALRYSRGASVARIAQRELEKGNTQEGTDLVPAYLRLPQAERERQEKLQQNQQKEEKFV